MICSLTKPLSLLKRAAISSVSARETVSSKDIPRLLLSTFLRLIFFAKARSNISSVSLLVITTRVSKKVSD